MKRSARKAGFTLIEVLLVLGILVALGSVGALAYSNIKAQADKKLTITHINDLCHAIDSYINEFGTPPEKIEDLITPPQDEALKSKWDSFIHLKDDTLPKDAWEQDFMYEPTADTTSGGPKYHVWSIGPDKDSGTDDDIKSWKEKQ